MDVYIHLMKLSPRDITVWHSVPPSNMHETTQSRQVALHWPISSKYRVGRGPRSGWPVTAPMFKTAYPRGGGWVIAKTLEGALVFSTKYESHATKQKGKEP